MGIIAKKFLGEAVVDVAVVEKLKDDFSLRRRSLFHLQQACEKALKAYFITVFVSALVILSQITSSEDKKLFGEAYKILREINRLKKPKEFRHDFEKFFKYMDRFNRSFSSGKMRKYLLYLIKRIRKDFEKHREQFLKAITRKFKLSYDKAIVVLDLMVNTLEMASKFIEQYKFTYKPVRFRRQNSFAPCIYDASKCYLEISEKIDTEFDKILDNALAKNRKIVEEVERHLEKLIEIFPELEKFIRVRSIPETLKYIKNCFKPLFAIPLHLCLSRYEQSSRYPDVSQPCEKEIEAIEIGLKAVKNLIRTIDYIFSFEYSLLKITSNHIT